ncbi:hypothetical protein C8F01DRAFT_1319976 [Mycena amicta]|nr:hypothetical protein C8F01DRAFT_1319976 [Mycena amicta]
MSTSNPLDFETTIRFIELIRLVKPALRWYQQEYETRPSARLPQDFRAFLMKALSLTDTLCESAWLALRDAAWARDLDPAEQLSLRTKYVQTFLQYGIPLEIGSIGRPLFSFCLSSQNPLAKCVGKLPMSLASWHFHPSSNFVSLPKSFALDFVVYM